MKDGTFVWVKTGTKKAAAVLLAFLVITNIVIMALPKNGFFKAEAETLSFDNYTYTMSADNAVITGTIDKPAGDLVIPSPLGNLLVIGIGTRAFSGCSGLTSVTIPDSVTSIGDSAFSDCTSLSSVTLGNSVKSFGRYVFYGCTALTELTLPASADTFNSYGTFDGSSLTAIYLPEGMTSLPNYIFTDCKTLASVSIPDSVTSIGYDAFSGCSGLTSVTIPDGVTSIGGSAFCDCSGLTSVTLPDGVTSIADSTFSGCSGITSVAIPDSVTSISSYAFTDCSGLTSVTIPDSVTSISSSAFSYCSRLESVNIGSGAENIDEQAFDNCYDLAEINVSGSNSVYSDIDGVLFTKDQKTLLKRPNKNGPTYYVPDGVTTIEQNAFKNNNDLLELHLCDGLTEPNDAVDDLLQVQMVFLPQNDIADEISYRGVTYLAESGVKLYGARAVYSSYDVIQDPEEYYTSMDYTTVPERDTVIVIDASGSVSVASEDMKDAAIDFCQITISQSGLNRVAVVAFTYDGYLVCDFSNDYDLLADKISKVGADGASDIASGMALANAMLERSNARLKNMIVMTDGEPNYVEGAFKPGHYGNDFECENRIYDDSLKYKAKYNVYTIGCNCGTDSGRQLLQDIQNAGFYNLEDEYNLHSAFCSIAGDIAGQAFIRENGVLKYTGAQDRDLLEKMIMSDLSYCDFNKFRGSVLDFVNTAPYTKDLDEKIWRNEPYTTRDLAGSFLEGWDVVDEFDDNNKSGFYGVVFKKGDNVVIAYRGTEMLTSEDIWADFDLFTHKIGGKFSKQANCSVYLYDRVRKKYGDTVDITVTGHSLGGALAAHVSAYRNVRADTFDGAEGHILGLTYATMIQDKISDDFKGIDNILFTNHTDPAADSKSDAIQHQNAELMNQNDYATNDNLNRSKLSCYSHGIYSIISTDDIKNKNIDFYDVSRRYSIQENYVDAGKHWRETVYRGVVDNVITLITSNGSLPSDFSVPYISSLTTLVSIGDYLTAVFMGPAAVIEKVSVDLLVKLYKDEVYGDDLNVILGTSGDDKLYVKEITPSYIKSVSNIIQSGGGSNKIKLSSGNDTVALNASPEKKLSEKDKVTDTGGYDVYVIEFQEGRKTFIEDEYGMNTIILKGFGVNSRTQLGTMKVEKIGENEYYSFNPNKKGHYIYILKNKGVFKPKTAAELKDEHTRQFLEKGAYYSPLPDFTFYNNKKYLDSINYNFFFTALDNYNQAVQLVDLGKIIVDQSVTASSPYFSGASAHKSGASAKKKLSLLTGSSDTQSFSQLTFTPGSSESQSYIDDDSTAERTDRLYFDRISDVTVLRKSDNSTVGTYRADGFTGGADAVYGEFGGIYYTEADSQNGIQECMLVCFDSCQYSVNVNGSGSALCGAKADECYADKNQYTSAVLDLTADNINITTEDEEFVFYANGQRLDTETVVLPESITLDKTEETLNTGDTLSISAVISECSDKTIRWESSDPSVASVEPNGASCTVTAVGPGTAYIAAISAACEDVCAVCTVTVSDRTAVMSFTESKICMALGANRTLDICFDPADYELDGDIVWSSSDPDIASVSSDGVISAAADGTCTVTASADGLTAECTVSVNSRINRPVESLTLSEDSVEMAVGTTMKISATAAPFFNTDQRVTWSSDKTSVVTVDAQGNLTALKAGEAVVTAVSAENADITAVCTVTVSIPEYDITETGTVNMDIWDFYEISFTVTPDNAIYTFASDNENVVTVTPEGVVRAVGAGATYICIKDGNGQKKDEIMISVKVPITGISIITGSNIIGINESVQAEIGYIPSNATVIPSVSATWSSANPDVATVSASGLITGKSKGTTVIKAVVGDMSNEIAISVGDQTILPLNIVFSGQKALVRFKNNKNDKYEGQIERNTENGVQTNVKLPEDTYTLNISKAGHTSYCDNSLSLPADTLPDTIILYSGDVTGDNSINAHDQAAMTDTFGLSPNDNKYNSAADFNDDSYINAKDRADIVANFGKSGTIID